MSVVGGSLLSLAVENTTASDLTPSAADTDAAEQNSPTEETLVAPNTESPAGEVANDPPVESLVTPTGEVEDETTKDTSLEYTASTVDGTKVHAYAATGVLPEGAVLQASKISESSDEFAAAKAAVEATGVEFDGMIALDIRFEVGGQEVEPNGLVQVQLELAADVVDGADLGSVAVQHLAETANGVQVETVADGSAATEGTVAVGEQAVKAEFTVDSFSSFTITWDDKGEIQTVTIKYVDQNGDEIECTKAADITGLKAKEVVTLSDYAYDIEGYTYQGAHIGTVDGTPLLQIRTNSDNEKIQYRNSQSGDWTRLRSSTILLVYEGSAPTPPTPPVIEQQLAHDKYVEEKADGTYDLTLTIAGAVGSETNKAKLDVIFVLDKSGSMKYDMTSDSGSEGARREAAGNAINGLTNSLVNNSNIDARFALIGFSNHATTIQGWTTVAGNITKQSKPTSNGGTNYQAGLQEAKTLLKTSRSGAMTAVIFVSDGNPTYYYSNKGELLGNGNSDSDGRCLAAAETEVGTLSANYFFTVGVGPKGNYQKLRDLKDAAIRVPNKNFYEGTDQKTLNAAFNSIQAQITQILCKDVTIVDTLSENVQLVTDESGQPKALTVSVKDSDGNIVASGQNSLTWDGVTITAGYNSATKKITLDFPDSYELKQGYTYLVTANIDATEKAYENYRNNGNSYPNTGDPGTGVTSAGQKGLYTNDTASVTYTYNGTTSTENYAMPVIQLQNSLLTIKKVVEGNMGDKDKDFTFTITVNGVEQDPITLQDGEREVLTLRKGSTVTIEETNAVSDGYKTTIQVGDGDKEDSTSTTFEIEGDTTVIFTNSRIVSAPTGVFCDVIPFVLMTAVALGGAATFVIMRRRRNGGAA